MTSLKPRHASRVGIHLQHHMSVLAVLMLEDNKPLFQHCRHIVLSVPGSLPFINTNNFNVNLQTDKIVGVATHFSHFHWGSLGHIEVGHPTFFFANETCQLVFNSKTEKVSSVFSELK